MLVVADERKARADRHRTQRARPLKARARRGSPSRTCTSRSRRARQGAAPVSRPTCGSVEALTESLERLSTDEVQAQGHPQLGGHRDRSDVMLASASNAIVLGSMSRRPEGRACQASRGQPAHVDLTRDRCGADRMAGLGVAAFGSALTLSRARWRWTRRRASRPTRHGAHRAVDDLELDLVGGQPPSDSVRASTEPARRP